MIQVNEIILVIGFFGSLLVVMIVMKCRGVPLPFQPLFGKARRIPHFDIEGKSLSDEWKNKMISKLKKRNQKKEPIKVIYGECRRGLESIEYALSSGFSVELICGPKIWNRESKERIKKLIEEYPQTFSFYTLEERPKRHAFLIGGHFLLEDPHEEDKDYEEALVIENTNKKIISHFNSYFEKMKSKGKKITISDIEEIEVLQ